MFQLFTTRTFLILIALTACFVLLINSSRVSYFRNVGAEPKSGVERLDRTSNSSILSNSIFRVTKESRAYDVNPDISCFLPGCKERNNHMAHIPCQVGEANEWIALGVQSMNRYLNGDFKGADGYNGAFLPEALRYFKQAIELDPQCPTPYANIGVLHLGAHSYSESLKYLQKALALYSGNTEKAVIHVMLGVVNDLLETGNALNHYTEAKSLQPGVSIRYFGIHYEPFQMSIGDEVVWKSLAECAAWQYFSPISIADYGLLDPGVCIFFIIPTPQIYSKQTQDFFIENRYIVLNKLVPPFVLSSVARSYKDRITAKRLRLDDGQSNRYYEHNGRIARYLQFQLTDYIRKVVAHNAKPTYTYFGGYIPGSTLAPHVDREQCEFTMSLTIGHFPQNESWLLSLGKKPLFDRVVPEGGIRPTMPPEEEIVDAELYDGDALLFMGRHLVHFRRGSLPPGQWLNQIFFHYVQENFEGAFN